MKEHLTYEEWDALTQAFKTWAYSAHADQIAERRTIASTIVDKLCAILEEARDAPVADTAE